MQKRAAFVASTAWYLWNFRRNVIAALVSEGWQVTVIAGADEWSSNLAKMDGIEVLSWSVSLNGSNPFEELRSLKEVARLLRQSNASVVFNNGIKANIYSGIASRYLGVNYINNISGLGMRIRKPDMMGRILSKLYAFSSSKAKALLVQNTSDRNFLRSRGLSEQVPIIRTHGSGVDLEYFQPTPLPDACPRQFVFVGRLQEDKGINEFVEVARRARDSGWLAEFTVVGDTFHTNAGAVDQETLKDWKTLGSVNFVGRQSDIRPYLDAAHALIMPSHGGEGLPKVILEAAASGRPAIVSHVDGCNEGIIEGQTGWLVPPQDSDALAKIIAEICAMSFPDLEMRARKARTLAEKRFSDKVIAEVCLTLAESALRPETDFS